MKSKRVEVGDGAGDLLFLVLLRTGLSSFRFGEQALPDLSWWLEARWQRSRDLGTGRSRQTTCCRPSIRSPSRRGPRNYRLGRNGSCRTRTT